MDHWVHDESLFISRKVGSALGVVQVYRCWSLDAPMGDNSFSLIGETSGPLEIAPATVWGQRDYLRLIEFLEVNSAMVNVRGHIILRSLVKSLRLGRADGPETYWRCLDVLPIHTFGLVRPADTHGEPQFLIVGGDVLSSTTPPNGIAGAGVWQDMYKKLEAEFNQLKLEVSTLKDTLAGVNNTLTDSQTENKKLVRKIEDQKSANKKIEEENDAKFRQLKSDISTLKDTLAGVNDALTESQTENKKLVRETENQKSANKQLQATLKNVEAERDSIKANLGDTLTENKKLVSEIDNQKSANKQLEEKDAKFRQLKLEVSSLKDTLAGVKEALTESQSENKKLTKKMEGQKSDKEQLEARLRDMDAERQKAIQEGEKLTIQVSQLVLQVNESVEKEADRWAGIASRLVLMGWLPNYPDDVHRGVYDLSASGPGIQLSNYHLVKSVNFAGDWSVYRNGDKVILTSAAPDPIYHSYHTWVRWNSSKIYWENKDRTGRLYCSIDFYT